MWEGGAVAPTVVLVGQIYATLAPVIFAGILNMVWVKLPLARGLALASDSHQSRRFVVFTSLGRQVAV